MLRGLFVLFLALPLAAEDWTRFRGPNGSGVAAGEAAAIISGQSQLWRTQTPPGVSSPIVVGGRVILTGVADEDLVVAAYDADSGRESWRAVAPRPRREKFHPRHGPASPTPASDGESIYVFFPDFGLLAYSLDGEELWSTALGPFTSVQGLAASPIVVDGKVALLVDQAYGSFVAAFDSGTGEEVWRVERPANFLGGYSTPSVYRPAAGPPELIVAGSMELTAYQLATGERLWGREGWLSPVGVPLIEGDLLIAAEPLNQAPPAFSGMKPLDLDGDGEFSREEGEKISGLVFLVDRIDGEFGDGDGKVDAAEWNASFEQFLGNGGVQAFRLGSDDPAALVWNNDRAADALASGLLYDGVLYTVRSGGIVSSIDPSTGETLKQGRLREALGEYSASPVAAAGRIYFASLEGKASTVKAGAQWEVEAAHDFGEGIQATPAITNGTIFVRTRDALYAFGS